MNSITFRCEIVTPMFLAGVDGQAPELRPPSIKGAMRFWWRAVHGHLPIEDEKDDDGNVVEVGLRSQETEIFGGGGENAKKSSFSLRVLTDIREMKKQDYQPLPHHTGGNNCTVCNDSKSQNTIKCKKNFKIKSITEGTFDIKISSTDFEKIEDLFVLTCVLGGFGKRSRRGFGSVKIVKRNDVDFSMPNDLESIYSYLSKFNDDYQLDHAENKIYLKNPATLNGEYSEYPYIEEIRIGHDYALVLELVERIGNSSHRYKTDSNGCASPRFSSPTYVSVLKNKGQYYPIITTLHFAPPNGITDNSGLKSNFKNAIL